MTSIITIWTRGTLGRWWSSEHCFGHSIKLRVHFWTTDSSVLNLRKFKYFHWRLNPNQNIIHKSEIFQNWIRIQIICSSLISLIEIERIITSHIPAPSTDHIPIRIQENFTKHTTVATVGSYCSSRHVSTCVPTPTYFWIWQSFQIPIQWLLCNTKFKKRLSKVCSAREEGGGRGSAAGKVGTRH